MIKVKSCLLIKGKSYEIGEYRGRVKDPDYIDGSLTLSINDNTIISSDMWDYIDQLWCYIINGLLEIKSDGIFTTFFPDQPIEMSLEKYNGVLTITIKTNTVYTEQVSWNEFLKGILPSATLFWTRIVELAPSLTLLGEEMKEKISRLSLGIE